MTKSEEIYQKACTLMPGGVSSPVRSFKAIGISPPVFKRGKGANLIDLDGRVYIDYCMSWGALPFGHADRDVVEAISKQASLGTSFGANSELELELAQMIVDSVPSIDMLRFVNSGTEAVMSALRLARSYTGKNKIVKFDGCYHGHVDSLLVRSGSGLLTLGQSSSAGIADDVVRDTISIPFNDIDLLEDVLSRYKNQIAAVIVEPVPANMGLILPKTGFLEELRMLTTANQALLIFDEVITGFRLGVGGAQKYFNVIPDITILGKIIGGGLPVGAYGASKEIMSLISPLGDVYQAGTLSGNPLAMAAGIATLKKLLEPGCYDILRKKTTSFIKNIQSSEIQITYLESLFTPFFSKTIPRSYSDVIKTDNFQFIEFYKKMLNKGVYLSPSPFEVNFLSLAH